MKRLILTRATDDNKRTLNSVENQIVSASLLSDISHFGDLCVAVPLVSVRQVSVDQRDLDAAFKQSGAVIVTSKNALPLLSSFQNGAAIPVCAVGEELSRLLRQDGRFDVVVSEPDVRSLKIAMERVFAKGQRFLYLRGRVVSDDLSSWAHTAGYDLVDFIVYEMASVTVIPRVLMDFLLRKEPSVIPFFSQGSFKIFRELIENNFEKAVLEPIQPLCISAGMLESVSDLFGKEAFVAKTPDLKGMSALIASQLFQK